MRAVNALALVLAIVGALNWALVGLFEFDLVAEIFGEQFGETNVASRFVYTVVGVAGLYLAVTVLPAVLQGRDAGRSYSRDALGTR